MRVLGVIPSRFQSSRFPGKPLIDLKGKSMIQRVYEGCSKSKLIDKLVVATDDDRIFQEVKSFGGEVEMTSVNHQSGTDRCAEVSSTFTDYDVVINIQGDEPLVDYRQIDALLSTFDENPDTHIATIGIPHQPEEVNNPNRIKMVCDKNMKALYFSRSAIPNIERANASITSTFPFFRHIGLYAYRASTLQAISKLPLSELEQIESLEQLRWMYHAYPIHVVKTNIETPNIDVPKDVQEVLKHL